MTQARERIAKPTIRAALLAALLIGVVLSLVASLMAADRALSTHGRESVDLDARDVALVIERELRLQAESLAHDGGIGRAARDLPWPLIRAAPGTAMALQLSVSGSGGRTVSGIVDGAVLVRPLASDPRRPWLILRAAGRPVATIGSRAPEEDYVVGLDTVALPGDRLEVEIGHRSTRRALRTTLWMLGVVAVVGLLVGLFRERRQTSHLAARTAELERLYEEVAQSNRMKSEFLANVSHELRTPLNAIVGFVEMLREGVYGSLSPRQALPVDRIAASASHLRQLVDRLLDIAKIAAGRVEVHREPLVLRPFVLDVASEMESLVNTQGLSLSIDVSGGLPRIRTDQTHLRQILINLIGNAAKYTAAGAIKVRAKLVGNGAAPAQGEAELDIGPPPNARASWVALQVCDTGVGIAPQDIERVFDEFEQVNAGARTDSARRGTGLGLAISRRLARLLGGELTLVSEVGRGSIFTVWLPVEPTGDPAS